MVSQFHRRVRCRTPRHWCDDLDVGDIVLFKSGVIRTVIDTFKRPDGRIVSAAMPILHCSWTKCGITWVDRWQLRTFGELHVGWVDIRRQPLFRKLIANIHKSRYERTMTCCDVVGVIE